MSSNGDGRIASNNQRKAFKEGRLAEDWVERLNTLGIAWEPRETALEENFQKLEQFNKKNGTDNQTNRIPSTDNPMSGEVVQLTNSETVDLGCR